MYPRVRITVWDVLNWFAAQTSRKNSSAAEARTFLVLGLSPAR
jgi:hypothetical protein